MTFQSTPSAWRVTSYADTVSRGRQISIHTLRMEGDVVKGFEGDNLEISIHTLRMEGDESLTWYITLLVVFQSTPSAWRVTKSLIGSLSLLWISIHTLRMEGDRRR